MRHLLVVALRADDASEKARLAPQLATVEYPLRDAFSEAKHRQVELHLRRELEVNRVDRLVGEVIGNALQQRFELVRADGDDDAVELLRKHTQVANG